MKFSERVGIIKAKDTIQIDDMDDDLKNGLWNAVQIYYFDQVKSKFIGASEYSYFFNDLWIDILKQPLDTMDDWFERTKKQIRDSYFSSWEWYEIYDFIEAIAKIQSPTDEKQFRKYCNTILERELSGFRFINDILTPITSSTEIDEIDSAIINSTSHKLSIVRIHLESALRKLSDRESPDYRNSIKESISAVEAIAKIISNNSKDSLGGALDKIKGKIKLHPSLERGFKQIYGYTSDADGIRHALTEESSCEFEDAKYILVSSCAFVNYLIVKANKADIEI